MRRRLDPRRQGSQRLRVSANPLGLRSGIIMILNVQIAFLTPPVGMSLIVPLSAFKKPFGRLAKSALPSIVLILGCLALVSRQPWIAMHLVSGKLP
jgi:C4-dicarboxylate transporter DctM subunit